MSTTSTTGTSTTAGARPPEVTQVRERVLAALAALAGPPATDGEVDGAGVGVLGVGGGVVLDPATAVADLGIDSMSLLQLIGDLEQEHGVELPDADLVGLRTVEDVVTLVARAVDLARPGATAG